MPNLKDLRNRKKSVESTKKITSAMKMIAAAKLRKAEENAHKARPYANLMARMLSDLVENCEGKAANLPLLMGKSVSKTHMIVVVTSNRGLCGGFNSSIVRHARHLIERLKQKGEKVKIICVGKKAKDQLRVEFDSLIQETFPSFDRPRFHDAAKVGDLLIEKFEADEFDQCTIVYNKHISALTQEVTQHSLIPFTPLDLSAEEENTEQNKQNGSVHSLYEYEPNEEQVLSDLLPRNLKVQIYRAYLENAASEQGARMAAMDGATRNANDMIKKLNLTYNRTRQAFITKELIEIISGAEAIKKA